MHLVCPSIAQALDYPFTGQFPPLKNLILIVQEMTQWLLKAKDHHIVYSDCVLGHFIATCLIQKLTEGQFIHGSHAEEDLFSPEICDWFVRKCCGVQVDLNPNQQRYFSYYSQVHQGFDPSSSNGIRVLKIIPSGINPEAIIYLKIVSFFNTETKVQYDPIGHCEKEKKDLLPYLQ